MRPSHLHLLPWHRKKRSWMGMFSSVQFVAQSCPTLCSPMNRSTPGLAVHHQLLEFTQTHVLRVGDAIQPSHPLSSILLLPPIHPASESFPMSQLFAWGGQSTGVSALASFLPKNTQDWSPLQYPNIDVLFINFNSRYYIYMGVFFLRNRKTYLEMVLLLSF